MPVKPAPIPVWRYTITLDERPTPLEVDAISYREDGPWTIFDDTNGTVLSRRTSTIVEVHRSGEPVSHQETDQL
jgi:hypothetical protein